VQHGSMKQSSIDAEVEGLTRTRGGRRSLSFSRVFRFRVREGSGWIAPGGVLVRWNAAGSWQEVGLELGICHCWGGLWQVGVAILPLLLYRVR
jgi:hypothetical protein